MAPRHFRYLLPADSPADPELIYFPYWRFKGMLFSSLPGGVRTKFIDVSRQAVRSRHIPLSVGLRSQALKLKFLTSDAQGRFIAPDVPLADMVGIFEDQFCKSLPGPILHHAHVGESTSMIYAPFCVRGRLFDAILKTPVRSNAREAFDPEQFETETDTGSILFVSTLCPHCGWDLDDARDSLVLHCKNCSSAWYPVGRKLKPVKFAVIEETGDRTLYLPFWRIRADISGLDLNTYADLIRVANLPAVPQPEDTNEPFRFWMPAFKVRPRVLMRLAENMTLGRLQADLKQALPAHPFHPVTLPVTEALEGLKILLAAFLKPRHRIAEVLPDVEVNARGFTLVYVPFREGHHDYVQTELQFAVNKNMLSLSKHL